MFSYGAQFYNLLPRATYFFHLYGAYIVRLWRLYRTAQNNLWYEMSSAYRKTLYPLRRQQHSTFGKATSSQILHRKLTDFKKNVTVKILNYRLCYTAKYRQLPCIWQRKGCQ